MLQKYFCFTAGRIDEKQKWKNRNGSLDMRQYELQSHACHIPKKISSCKCIINHHRYLISGGKVKMGFIGTEGAWECSGQKNAEAG